MPNEGEGSGRAGSSRKKEGRCAMDDEGPPALYSHPGAAMFSCVAQVDSGRGGFSASSWR